jgi:hypothetical protein
MNVDQRTRVVLEIEGDGDILSRVESIDGLTITRHVEDAEPSKHETNAAGGCSINPKWIAWSNRRSEQEAAGVALRNSDQNTT